MKSCSSYHSYKEIKFIQNKQIETIVGRCWGTKECEPCSCNGDKSKCDFYPELRREATLSTIDKIIRCKDCNVPHNRFTGCPKLNGLVTPPEFFCGFAEEK